MNTAIQSEPLVAVPAKVEAPSAVASPPSIRVAPKREPMPFKEAFRLLQADMRRKQSGFASGPGESTFTRYVKLTLELGSMAVIIFRYGQWATRLKNPLLRFVFAGIYWFLKMAMMMAGGISVQPGNNIGPGFIIHNFSGIFILTDTVGENFTVNQGVTVGNLRGSPALPEIGNNVYLAAGAKVLGAIKIGDNSVVAANSLVIMDVPSNATVMGVPARVVARNTTSEYLKI